MKTMFTMGFASNYKVFDQPIRLQPVQMGQGYVPPVMNFGKSDRDKLLTSINRAAEEYKAIGAWKQMTPTWATLLGSDADRFNYLLDLSNDYSNVALVIQNRLSAAAQGTGWDVNTDEWNGSTSWVSAIDEASRIMQGHQPMAAARAGVAPPPAASTVSPLAIGVGAAAALGLLAVVLS